MHGAPCSTVVSSPLLAACNMATEEAKKLQALTIINEALQSENEDVRAQRPPLCMLSWLARSLRVACSRDLARVACAAEAAARGRRRRRSRVRRGPGGNAQFQSHARAARSDACCRFVDRTRSRS